MIRVEDVCDHLKFICGYTVKEDDSYLLSHLITEVETLIKNFCHVRSIPAGAVHPAVTYICGLFLKHKIRTGTLTDADGQPLYEFYTPESSVRIGDVTISSDASYSYLEGDNGVLAMVEEMADKKNFLLELTHFRKVKMP